ncbi:UMP-CMP kinase [Mizuhopecten yessoensis]|uniref:UMP-CMP kinase n=1 Tax=Mizuhopecten yessoensis TaxID=6573 RepID=A0A210QBW2_MIZYE|nr:UMP-CMP kinase [Mizuhopecten yessoensis]
MTEAAKYNVIFVLGGPGAGKGTQCDKIIRKFGYVHLSAGDLLRAERKDKQSELGEEIARHIEVGSIVPVAITCALLQREMKKAKENDNKDSFLIDGFPRNKDNLDGWNKEMSEKVNLKTVLFFNCPEDVTDIYRMHDANYRALQKYELGQRSMCKKISGGGKELS